jgi:hypothetical protein
MIDWFESLPTAGSAIVIVGGFVLLTLAAGACVAKLTPREVRLEHNDLAGFILAVIGVVYAVLLAFVAIGVWERFQQAETRTFDEAGMLTVAYRDAGSFPQSRALRDDIRAYTQSVVTDEWPKMRAGGESVESDKLLEKIDRAVRSLPVDTASRQNVQARMLEAIDAALMDRDSRLSEGATGINGLMWVVLVAGAVVTVAFTYLFGFRHNVMQQIMIGSLGVLIGLVLFLAVALDFPFRGSISVQPEAFHTALHTYESIGP